MCQECCKWKNGVVNINMVMVMRDERETMTLIFSKKIVEICDLEKQDICYIKLGIEIITLAVIGIGGMIIISHFMNDYTSWLPYVLSFFMLRTYAGGYHANSPIKCLVLSELMYFVSLLISQKINCNIIICLANYMFTFIVIVKYAPIEQEKKKLTEELQEKCRCYCRIILIVSFFIIIALYECNSVWCQMYCVGMFFSTLSIIVSIIASRIIDK